MHKIAHDKRAYYCPRLEEIYDPEWAEAESANEEPRYYWCYTDVWKGKPKEQSARFIHLYKPSVAKLFAKRTGWVMEEVFKE